MAWRRSAWRISYTGTMKIALEARQDGAAAGTADIQATQYAVIAQTLGPRPDPRCFVYSPMVRNWTMPRDWDVLESRIHRTASRHAKRDVDNNADVLRSARGWCHYRNGDLHGIHARQRRQRIKWLCDVPGDIAMTRVQGAWPSLRKRLTLVILSYIVEVGTTVGGTHVAVIDTGSLSTSYLLTGLRTSVNMYHARIRARNACGVSAPSNEATTRASRRLATARTRLRGTVIR